MTSDILSQEARRRDLYRLARAELYAKLPQPSINGEWLFGEALGSYSRTPGRGGVRICWPRLLCFPKLDTPNAVEIRIPGRVFGNCWSSWETYGTVGEALAEPRLGERLLSEMQEAIAAADAWAERVARQRELDQQARVARFERALAPRRGWFWGQQ